MGEKVRPFVSAAANTVLAKADLGITIRFGKQAKMTYELFYEFLGNLNEDMKTQGRHVLLFADSSPSHKGHNWSFSNVRLELFPPEVSSFVQPLDLGIVRLFKTRYRTELLRHVASLQNCEVTPQHASWWLAAAWKMVPEDAIRRCFNEAGFPVACTEFYLTSDALDVELAQLSEFFDCRREWVGVAPYEFVTFDNVLETDSDECSYPRSSEADGSAESEGSRMTYEEMMRTVDRLHGFVVANEPDMVVAVRDLKCLAERAILKHYVRKRVNSRKKPHFDVK